MARTKTSLALLLAVTALAVAAVLAVTAGRPSPYRVEGDVRLQGPPGPAAAVLADLQQWAPWSAQKDVQRTYGGTPGRPGSSCYWSGGGDGKGRLTLLGVTPEQLELEVELGDRGADEADLVLALSPDAAGTRVRWSLSGERARWLGWLGRIPAPLERFVAQLGPALEGVEGPVQDALRQDHRVERSARVAASPAAVLRKVGDLRRWNAWLPRERLDPGISRTYGGPSAGRGQSYYWSGNDAVGRGRLTILDVAPDHIDLERESAGPHPSSSDLELRVAPDGGGARITWIVTGAPSPPAGGSGDPDLALASEIDEELASLVIAVEATTLGRADP